MAFQKTDNKEINKLRSLYISKLKELNSENNLLKLQLDDKKETLKLNQDLLYCTIQSFIEQNSDEKIRKKNNIKNLIERSKIISDKIFLLIEEKSEKGKKIEIIKKEIPVIQGKIVDKINILTSQSEQKSKEIFSEENNIKKLKTELDKLRRNAFFKKARTEILVAPPTKSSVEVNIELINTRSVFQKASKMHQEKKKKAEEIWRTEKNLKDEMIKLKKNTIKEGKIKEKEESEFLKDIGYKKKFENYEKEEEEESEDSDSSDDDSDEGGDNKKKKEADLKKLNEQYNKLKIKFDEIEKQLKEYKINYRNLKRKIEELKKKEIKNDNNL